MIEAVYVKYGSGAGNFEVFSLNVGSDNDAAINQYRSTYGATNPYFAGCGAQGTEFGVSGVPAFFLLFPAKFKNPSGGTPDSIYGWSWGGFSPTIGSEIETKLQSQGYLPQSINTPVNKNFGVSIYPNPAADNFTVIYTGRNINGVVIEVYNIMGEKVEIPAVNKNTGENTINVDASSLADGMYFVKIINGNEATTLKLQVVK